MPRFTLYRGESAPITDATEHLRSVGARVIAARPGLALVETTQKIADELRQTLTDWRISEETSASIAPPRPKLPNAKKK